MNDILNSLFNESSSIGIVEESDFHNHIINESIILDKVNNNIDSLNKVLEAVGGYAVRDNLLESVSAVDTAINSFEDSCCKERAAVLAIAKEANDPDYESYVKAFILCKTLFKNLKAKYCERAAERLQACTTAVENNPRVMEAIDKVNNNELV